jgi:hypothetical protein
VNQWLLVEIEEHFTNEFVRGQGLRTGTEDRIKTFFYFSRKMLAKIREMFAKNFVFVKT